MSDSNPARARFARLNAIFIDVVEKYRSILALPQLVCSQFDDETSPNRKLDFNAIDYKTDIENATAASFRGLPDEDKLQQTWLKLVANDQTTEPALINKVIRTCGKIYQQRGLQPNQYLRHIKRGRGERVKQ